MSDPRAPHPPHLPVPPPPFAPPLAPPFVPPSGATPPPARTVRSLPAALGWLGGLSVIAPLAVLLMGALWFAVKWLGALALVVLTGGMIAGDETVDAWLGRIFSWQAFTDDLVALLPWAASSFVLSLVIGGLLLLLLRGTTGVKYWHPVIQGVLASFTGVVLALLLGLFFAV